MLLNKKGVSMLYVLMALVCVGAMGSLVLSMAKKEKADSSLRYSSELARYGATGGLVLAVNEPLRTKEFEDLMQKWYKVYYSQAKKETLDDNEKYLKLDKTDGIIAVGTSGYYQDQNGNKLRARVVNVDFSGLQQDPPVINMMIQCESIDKSGSRAKNVAFYKIYGFEEERDENIPTSALYMGGGMDEIDAILEVTGIDDNTKGDTFLRGSANINTTNNIFGNLAMYKKTGNGGGFWLKATGAPDAARSFKGSTFYGPAYWGADGNPTTPIKRVMSDAPNKFYGKFALDSNMIMHATGTADSITFYNDVYIKGNFSNNAVNRWKFPANDLSGLSSSIKTKGALYTHADAIYRAALTPEPNPSNPTTFDFTAETSPDITKMYWKLENNENDNSKKPSNHSINNNDLSKDTVVFDFLNIGEEPKSISIHLDKLGGIDKFSTTVGNSNKRTGITGKDLNDEYEKQKAAGKLFKEKNEGSEDGWMRVHLDDHYGSIFAADGAGDKFTGKMVLVISGNLGDAPGGNINLFTSADESNSLILIENKRNANQLGHNDLIRGLIVKRGDGKAIITPRGQNMVLRGAVYCIDGGKLKLEGSTNKITIKYEKAVLTQIMKELPGVVCIEDGKPCDNSDSDSKLKDLFGDFSKISAKQVSRLF